MPSLLLEKAERKALAAQAHPLNPVVLLGAAGLTPAVLQDSTSSAAVQLIGNVLVLYRPKPDEDDPV